MRQSLKTTQQANQAFRQYLTGLNVQLKQVKWVKIQALPSWLIGSLRLGKNRVPRLFSLLYVKKAKSKNIVYGENLVQCLYIIMQTKYLWISLGIYNKTRGYSNLRIYNQCCYSSELASGHSQDQLQLKFSQVK